MTPRPSELLGALAALALSLLLAVLRPPGAGIALLVVAAALALSALLAWKGGEGGVLGLARNAAPYAVMLTVFSLLQPAIVAMNPARYDALFGGLDQHWWGAAVQAWRGAFGRPEVFTDAVYVAYISFYVMPVVILLSILARRGRAAFERSSFTVLLGFYLSFIGYFLWPTSGPRLPYAQQAVLGGGAVSRAIRAFLHLAEGTTLDAFPSGHTAMSLLTAHLGVRAFERRWVAPVLAWAAAIVFATVYVQAHYAVDVLAGVALYAITLAVAGSAFELLGGRRWSAERALSAARNDESEAQRSSGVG